MPPHKLFYNMSHLFKYFIFLIVLYQHGFLAAQSEQVTLLYFNDAHEISPVKDRLGNRGGVARLKSVIDSVTKTSPEIIVVFGGDLAGGTLFGGFYRGHPMVEVFNKLPVDIANFGQHDFDFGLNNTMQLINKSKFNWISSNLRDSFGDPLKGVSTHRVIVKHNIRIGFIGLTDAIVTSSPIENVRQQSLFQSAQNAVAMLQAKDVDIIVALTQMNKKKNEQLLLNEPDIDIVLSEEIFENRTNIYYVGRRPIITPCGNMGSVIQVDLRRRGTEIQTKIMVHPVDSTVTENPDIKKIQTAYQDSLDQELSQPITRLVTPLIAGINDDFKCRWGETNLGNLITDSYRNHFDADLAVINGGGIRANISGSIMTAKDAYSALPFGNKICLISIRGDVLKQMFEHGAASALQKSGSFLQISGGRYGYQPKGKKDQRIKWIKIGDKNLDINKCYRLALPDFMLFGGDGFSVLPGTEILIPRVHTNLDARIFINYCRTFPEIDISLEDRITIINEAP